MRLPKKLNILGLSFTVEYFNFDQKLQFNGTTGNSKNMYQKIQIDTAACKEHQFATLLHEIMHILATNLHLESINEHEVTTLSTGLYQVLNDNKLLRE